MTALGVIKYAFLSTPKNPAWTAISPCTSCQTTVLFLGTYGMATACITFLFHRKEKGIVKTQEEVLIIIEETNEFR